MATIRLSWYFDGCIQPGIQNERKISDKIIGFCRVLVSRSLTEMVSAIKYTHTTGTNVSHVLTSSGNREHRRCIHNDGTCSSNSLV